jgi:acyl carrier protein
METKGINSAIRDFIVQKFPIARKRAISDETPLLQSGIIDSLGVLDLVGYLERSFDISIADEELIPENFADINCIGSLVARKRLQLH